MHKLKIMLLASALSLGTGAVFAQQGMGTSPNAKDKATINAKDKATTGQSKNNTNSGSTGANVNANDANTSAKTPDAKANANANANVATPKKAKVRKHRLETTGSALPSARTKMKTPDGPGTGGPSNRGNTGASNKLNQ